MLKTMVPVIFEPIGDPGPICFHVKCIRRANFFDRNLIRFLFDLSFITSFDLCKWMGIVGNTFIYCTSLSWNLLSLILFFFLVFHIESAPTSFEGNYGRIIYRVRAFITTPRFAKDYNTEKAFYLLRPLNLNELPDIWVRHYPIGYSQEPCLAVLPIIRFTMPNENGTPVHR